MTAFELIVVLGALVAGWVIVSYLFARFETASLEKLDRREIADTELAEIWPKVLGASKDAPLEDLDIAFEKKAAALRRMFPTVMTDVESARYERILLVLQRAHQCARDAHSDS